MFLTAYQSQKYLNPHYYLDKLTIVCGVAFQWKIGPVSEYKANKQTLIQCLGYLLKRIAKFLETLVIPLLLITHCHVIFGEYFGKGDRQDKQIIACC